MEVNYTEIRENVIAKMMEHVSTMESILSSLAGIVGDITACNYLTGEAANAWNTDREAKGLTDFEKGSCSETIYNCVGNISTKVTVSRFKSEAKGKLKDIIGFDELFPREENELIQIKDGYDKINGGINKLKDAQAVMPNYSDMIKEATTYEKIKELEENGRQW